MSEWTYDEPDVGTWWMEWPGGAIEAVEVFRPSMGAFLGYTRSGDGCRYQVSSAKGHRWCKAKHSQPPPRKDKWDEMAEQLMAYMGCKASTLRSAELEQALMADALRRHAESTDLGPMGGES